MFYSQLLLSKKGALGVVWMAAHCHKRLRKDQVQQTCISSSVDKILDDEVHVVTHRILAFLLLGIVRIYSKKVDYLFHDCHEILDKLCNLKTGKKSKLAAAGASRTHYHSITFPKRFELDAFDLEILDDQDLVCVSVGSHEEIMLADRSHKDGSTSGLFNKGNIASTETRSATTTPVKDVFSPHHMIHNFFTRTSFSLEDRLDPMVLDEDEEEQMRCKPSNEIPRSDSQRHTSNIKSDSVVSRTVPSLEKLRGTQFSSEDSLMLDEAEKQQQNDNPSSENIKPNLEIQDIELDFATERSPQGSEKTGNLGTLHNSGGFLSEYSPDFKMLNEAEKEQDHDKQFDGKDERCGVTDDVGPKKMKSLEVVSEAEKEQDHDKPLDGKDERCGVTDDVGPKKMKSLEVVSEAEKEQDHDKPFDGKDEWCGVTDDVGPKQMKSLEVVSEAEQEHGHDKPCDKKDEWCGSIDDVRPKKMKSLEVVISESIKCERPEDKLAFSTKDFKLPAGVGTPESVTVRTPAAKEGVKILKKRKTLFDSSTVVFNKILKSWIEEDPSDLKRPKRESPKSLLHAWRARKLANIPQSFFEPLISGISMDLASLQHKKPVVKISVEIPSNQDDEVKSPVANTVHEQIPSVQCATVHDQIPDVGPVGVHEEILVVGSPVTQRSQEQTPFAPGTPVARVNSFRSHEAGEVADSDILELTSSIESMNVSPCTSEGVRLDDAFEEETNSFGEDVKEKDGYSARTRLVGSFLITKFLDKKRQNEEKVLSLTKILAGKRKKESARLFYEILVLKTRNCINVQQQIAFGDICLQETSKLKQAFEK